MSGLLAAVRPPRPIVIEKGGTAWWIPLLIALGVTFVAAGVSYWVTWRFKRAEVNRDSAIRARDLVDEAEQLVAQPAKYAEAEGGGASTVSRLLTAARIRAQPLADDDLDDRFQAAGLYLFDVQEMSRETSGTRHWLMNAIVNVRDALLPHLAAPDFVPRRRRPGDRSFPTKDELSEMKRGRDGQALIDDLVAWRATGQKR
jgi:hypothetical protein